MKVRDLMVPLSEYATVPQEATLHEAIIALEKAQKKCTQRSYLHRAVLVLDDNGQTIGKLSQRDLIKSLEPRYRELTEGEHLTRLGFSRGFKKYMRNSQGLWQQPLDNLCEKAGRIKIKDVMYTPAEGEYVEEDESLDQGIHRLVIGHHQSLLVTRGAEVVGVLRLADVFSEVCTRIKSPQS